MAFGAHILDALETVLSDGFEFHNQLDTFLARSGVHPFDLDIARRKAEARSRDSQRGYSRAPKRFVVQEVLQLIGNKGAGGETTIGNLIATACKADFSRFSSAQAAAELLKRHQAEELKEKAAADARKREEKEAREREREREQAAAGERRANQLRQAKKKLLQEFLALTAEQDRQRRGYALERFLAAVFEFEGLEPRGSFIDPAVIILKLLGPVLI
jgi:hypothetical protein